MAKPIQFGYSLTFKEFESVHRALGALVTASTTLADIYTKQEKGLEGFEKRECVREARLYRKQTREVFRPIDRLTKQITARYAAERKG